MRKNFLARMFVLLAAFTLVLAGCDDLISGRVTAGGDSGGNTGNPNGGNTISGDDLPKTVKTVLGYGYDITGNYAYSPDIKPAILDLDKLLEAKRVKEDPNLRYGEFETISGKDINEYMRNITAKVSYKDNANIYNVVSFSNEVGVNFGTELTKKAEYAFATSTSRFVTGAYNIGNKSGLDAYFTQEFANDAGTMSPDQLIKKYGTHVMLGAVLGARVDYHLSVKKTEQNNITNLGAYVKQRAEVTYKGVTAGASTTGEVDTKFAQYFETDITEYKTKVFGGKVQYGQSINDKKDYDKWIESIAGNEIWIDYYPNSLIPLSDFVTDKSRSDALAQAIVNYCSGKEIGVLLPSILTIERYPTPQGDVIPKSGLYSANTPIKITASPNSGYQFIGWTVIKDTAPFGNPENANTTVTLSSDATIRANFLAADIVNANYYKGEIGKLSLKLPLGPTWFATDLYISYLDNDGKETKKKVGNITAGKDKTADPGDYGIPDGYLVRIRSEINAGENKDGNEYFMYRKGNTKTASYNHSGTTYNSTLKFNGVN